MTGNISVDTSTEILIIATSTNGDTNMKIHNDFTEQARAEIAGYSDQELIDLYDLSCEVIIDFGGMAGVREELVDHIAKEIMEELA
jgi:hypothetical protein